MTHLVGFQQPTWHIWKVSGLWLQLSLGHFRPLAGKGNLVSTRWEFPFSAGNLLDPLRHFWKGLDRTWATLQARHSRLLSIMTDTQMSGLGSSEKELVTFCSICIWLFYVMLWKGLCLIHLTKRGQNYTKSRFLHMDLVPPTIHSPSPPSLWCLLLPQTSWREKNSPTPFDPMTPSSCHPISLTQFHSCFLQLLLNPLEVSL